MKKKNYQISKFVFETQNGDYYYRHMITKDSIPLLEINQYIDQKSLRNTNTGKQYAKKLVLFLNWLDNRGSSYEVATNQQVKSFINYLIYGDISELKVQSLEVGLSYSTLNSYITVITDFYRWLDDNYQSQIQFLLKRDTKHARKSYLYGQIYSYDYKYIIDRYLPRLKSTKDYIKWYTDEEKLRICNSFSTLRDESVFRLTLEGLRIDEALSVRLNDFDAVQGIIKPSRSKGKSSVESGRENHLRVVALPKETCALLERYIATERMLAENESMVVSQYIFINIKADKYQGQPLSYRNYLRILKLAAKKAGFNSERIRTHSGRSTKVMDILEYGALHPEKGLSDVELLETFGWKSTDSIEPYRNHNNPIIAKSLIEKLHNMKENDHD
jgi:integrase